MKPSGPRRTRFPLGVAVAALAWGIAVAPVTAQPGPGERFSFVVVGHIRGNSDAELYPRIDELLERIGSLKPDLLFITGDMIWGSIPAALADRAAVVDQWERLDAKLSTLGIPVYRVPGNHDIHDPTTRDVFFERYGGYPRTVEYRGARFFLFNSTFTPTGDAPVPATMKLGKTVRLDSAQVRFLTDALTERQFAHEFLLMHHVLWWADGAPWWTEVHPRLAAHGARAVFTGDLGPTMYSHLSRDGVEYFRSIVNGDVDNSLAGRPNAAARIIPSLQFETLLHVTIDGPAVRYRVEPVGALSSAAFSPERWREAFGPGPDPGRYYDPATFHTDSGRRVAPRSGSAEATPSALDRLWEAVGSPLRIAALMGLAGIAFGSGLWLGKARRSGGRPPA